MCSENLSILQLSTVSLTFVHIICSFVILIGIPSNLIVILTIVQSSSLRRRACNLLIVNLCLSDLITVLVDIPLIWKMALFKHIGKQCCYQLFFHVFGIASQASALVSIALERFKSVDNPFSNCKAATLKKGVAYLLSCWLLAMTVALTQLVVSLKTDSINEFCLAYSDHTMHKIATGSGERRKLSSVNYVIIIYGSAAFGIIVFYYICILYSVKKHLSRFEQNSTVTLSTKVRSKATESLPTPAEAGATEEQKSIEDKNGSSNWTNSVVYGDYCVLSKKNKEKGKRKYEAEIAKRLFWIIGTYLLLWLPYPLFLLSVKEFDLSLKSDRDTVQSLYLLHLLTTLASSLNPITYTLPNEEFRQCFLRLFPIVRGSRARRSK